MIGLSGLVLWPYWLAQRVTGNARCRLGSHKYTKLTIPIICPETGIQSMFVSQHCERLGCDGMRIFANWRYPWEPRHRVIKR